MNSAKPRATLRKGGWALAIGLTSIFTQGCLFGGLRVEEVATSAQKPSNVAIYLSVANGGTPVTGLTASNFVISEDGQVVPAEQTQQVLLGGEKAAAHRTLLLLDMSGAVTDGDARTHIESAAAAFVTRARVTQPVSVFAFDGAPALRFIADFAPGGETVSQIPGLATYEPRDTSSNLNGAIIEAITQLDARLMSAQKPIRIGSLVIFARGPDLAGRVSEAKVSEVLDDTKHQTFAIAFTQTPGLRAANLGDDGVFTAPDLSTLSVAFDEAGTRVADSVAQHYLLSYCSPARAGVRRLRVDVNSKNDKGEEVKGSLTTEFDATGFASGCNPSATPRFVVRATPEKAAAAPDEAPSATKSRTEQPARRPGTTQPGSATPPPTDDDEIVPPPAKPGYAQ